MTLAEFRKLKHRDFGNGAVLDEIERIIESRDALLTACQAVVIEFVDGDCRPHVGPIRDIARAAIAKATNSD